MWVLRLAAVGLAFAAATPGRFCVWAGDHRDNNGRYARNTYAFTAYGGHPLPYQHLCAWTTVTRPGYIAIRPAGRNRSHLDFARDRMRGGRGPLRRSLSRWVRAILLCGAPDTIHLQHNPDLACESARRSVDMAGVDVGTPLRNIGCGCNVGSDSFARDLPERPGGRTGPDTCASIHHLLHPVEVGTGMVMAWSCGPCRLLWVSLVQGALEECRRLQSFLAVAKLVFGVTGFAVFAENVHVLLSTGLPHFLLPFAWLVAASGTDRPAEQLARLALAAVAVMQPLIAYPVAGTQLAPASVLLSVVAAVCLADGFGHSCPERQASFNPVGSG